MVDITTLNQKWQQKLADANVGQAERDTDKPKFFIIWAYLTVSGFHHVGHMRGYSYTDAIARYKRLRGFNVLLAAGGHASGNGAVGKAQLVATGDKEAIDYYKDMGLTDADIESIKTPEGFVDYFSKKYQRDYNEYGFLGDWRRFTVTTDPDYNKFIQWQFNKLKQNDLLIQKPYFGFYSLKSGPVAVDPSESDLQKGGNAEKTEYTMIKLPLVDEENTFVAVATLRPETMVGQTNVWMHPDAKYVHVTVNGEYWIVSVEAAEKLMHQMDDVTIGDAVDPRLLMGKLVHAPLANRDIPILPATFCDPDKGTGAVTSVPSDAPLDYIALKMLQDDTSLITQYGVDPSVVTSLSPIAILKSKDFGDFPAVEICEQMGISSLDQKEKLDTATKEIYKKGFHTGILLDNAGDFAGMRVSEAKDAIRDALIASGDAHMFYDLSEEVICRMGGKVIVKKFDDQWFIRYSDEKLTTDTKQHVAEMSVVPEQYHQNLPNVLDWFEDRACARQGRWLGTKLPFDENYTVEPISDSTLYPLYYLVSNYVEDGSLTLDNLTEAFFDFVYLQQGDRANVSASSGVSEELLQRIADDVGYWYPLDINLGGKEHQTVHFPVFLMNHVGVLPKHMWPKGLFVNWWVTGKGGKISKSKGGAKSIQHEAKTYSVDAIRLYYAHIANPFVDVVFDPDYLAQYKSRLERIMTEVENVTTMSVDESHELLDAWLASSFNHRLSLVHEAMEDSELKAACDQIYFGMLRDIQWYVKRGGTNKSYLLGLTKEWTVLMSMFTPFVAEELYAMLGNDTFACQASFPIADTTLVDESRHVLEDAIQQTGSDILQVRKLVKEDVSTAVIIVSDSWKYDFYAQLNARLAETTDIGALMKEFTGMYPDHKQVVSKTIQKAMKTRSVGKAALDSSLEFASYTSAIDYLKTATDMDVRVVRESESSHTKASMAVPGKPALVLE